jgi:hypothetical protein
MEKGVQLEIGFNGAMVTIPLAEYEKLLADSQQLKDISGFEKHITRMFDSDSRVGLAILERVRKI